MNQHWVDPILDEYIGSLKKRLGIVLTNLDFDSQELLRRGFSTPCYAVFFTTLEKSDELEVVVSSAEEEIRQWQRVQSRKHIDLNLVLVCQSRPSESVVAQTVRDPILCRKFVLSASDADALVQQLTFLPFGPLDVGKAQKLRILSLSPARLLKQSGASEDFATRLVANRPGAQQLAESIVKKEILVRAVSVDSETNSEDEDAAPSAKTQSSPVKGRLLCSLGIEGFRGIGGKSELAIAPSVTVVYGINGTGKTTICDAIEWGVTGKLKRLADDADASSDERAGSIISHFAASRTADVRIAFGGGLQYVNRSVGRSLKHAVSTDGEDSNWGAIQAATESDRRPGLDLRLAREAFRTSHLLEQSTIRDFLDTNPEHRFEALNRILGYDEFVRINRKTSSVCSHLQEHIDKLGPQQAGAKQELSEVENQAAVIAASIRSKDEALGGEPSIEILVGDILKNAQSLGLAVQKPSNSTAGSSLKNWAQARAQEVDAFAAANAKTMAEATACVESLRSLTKTLSEVPKLRALVTARSEEVSKLEVTNRTAEDNIEKAAKRKRQLEAKLTSLKSASEALSWALKIASEITARTASLARHEKDIEKQSAQIAGIQERLKTSKSVQVKTKRRQIEKKEEVHVALAHRKLVREVAESTVEWASLAVTLKKLSDEDKDISAQIKAIEEGIAAHDATLKGLKARLQPVEHQLTAEQSRYSRRAQLLASLREILAETDSSCPLCGSTFKSHEDLLTHVAEAGDELPPSLKSLISQVESSRAQISTLVSSIKEQTQLVYVLRKQKESAVAKLSAGRVRLGEFRNRALKLDLIPADTGELYVVKEEVLLSLLSNEPSSRLEQELSTLENALEHAESEITDLEKTLAAAIQNREDLTRKKRQDDDTLESLRAQASDRGAADLLQLPHDEARSSLEKTRKAIDEQTRKLQSVEEQLQARSREKDECTRRIAHTKKGSEEVQAKLRAVLEKESELKSELARLGYEGPLSYESAQSFMDQLQRNSRDAGTLQQKGAVLWELLNVETLKNDLSQIRKRVGERRALYERLEEEVRTRKGFLGDVKYVLEKFRGLTVGSMAETLNALSGPLNGIFERLNGHPLFGALRISPDETSKTVTFRVQTSRCLEKDSPPDSIQDLPPRSYLSDAQLNIVALSIFMAIALYQTWSKLKLIVIDDPVQQLDDLNAASFLELLREISTQNQRQFLITTCNAEFYKLAVSKLSCLNTREETRFRAYRLEGLRPEGPEIVLDAPYWENAVVQSAG